MPNDFTTELLLAGVGAGMGLLIGVVRFIGRHSSGRHINSLRLKRGRPLEDTRTYIPRPFAEVEADYEQMKKEWRAREEHRRILRSAFAPDPSAVQLGDTVAYAFKDAPERRIRIRLTRDEFDAGRGIIPMRHPIAVALLRGKDGGCARVGDELEISAGGQQKQIVVLDVIKSDSSGHHSPQSSPRFGRVD